ncbi:MAG: helix-turn-helix transcriptional regulator [Oscillospiraceae bacterium]|nr:helix-turn-helix transcriptional regulator [Oscillospiraceae bacterium]
MFSDRLSELMRSLDLSAQELSIFSGFDKSNLSRFVNGIRTPKFSGRSVAKITDGIVRFCSENNKTELLRTIISSPESGGTEALRHSVALWLFSDTPVDSETEYVIADNTPFPTFGRRLGAVMKLAGISNKHLGTLLDLDPSVVSRFKNGLRTPKSDEATTDRISYALFNVVCEQNKLDYLAKLMGYGGQSENSGDYYVAFRSWLYDLDPRNDFEAVNSLIDNILAMPSEPQKDIHPLEPDDVPSGPDAGVYFGIDGLKSAILRLFHTILRERAQQLLIYSDQEMSWILADQDFAMKCYSYISKCTEQGMKVTIVHDTSNDLVSVFRSLSEWLPMYMAGVISSYRNTKKSGDRFTASMFMCPGIACINGVNAKLEDTGSYVYRYDTDIGVLNAFMVQFDRLLAESDPFITAHNIIDIPHFEALKTRDLTIILNTLSFSTMPKETVVSVIARSNISTAERTRILEFWNVINYTLLRSLNEGCSTTYCIPILPLSKIGEKKVKTDTPGIEMYYTPEDYRAHLINILNLLDRFENLKVFVLPPDTPQNTNITIFSDFVDICNLSSSSKVFTLSGKRIIEAFNGYAEMTEMRCRQNCPNAREEIRKALES